MSAPRISEFRTRDPQEAHAQMSVSYADHRLVVRGDVTGFEYRQHRINLGDARIDSFQNTLTTEYHVPDLGFPLIVRVLRNTLERRTAGQSNTFGPGDVFLAARPNEGYFSLLNATSVQIVGLDLSLFAAVDADAPGRLARLSLEPLSHTAVRFWNQAAAFAVGTATNASMTSGPLVLGQSKRMLAAAALSLFDPELADASAVSPGRASANATVRRAVSFMETNLDVDTGVGDVARASHVSVRGLQLAFRSVLGTTPMAFLRRARLDQVRRELQQADPSTGISVAQTAQAWGFARPSRFSAQYRAEFGELPSQTLRKR